MNTSPTFVLSLLYLFDANLSFSTELCSELVLSCAPDETIIVEVDSEGVDAGDEHVQTKIKFCV